ncbi:PREDICTED: putative BTB/POZ domain-containing protein At3g08660 [Camelina sativa]|uniref:BTB/POZ domain-containing protein At3g08660 n=1 Tax=Camelina sativa TaxID=90675 RepID=A0ABM0W1S6_CAMSA|nr:PREDICTED: putative BTB/POZ domain-containing protein At3g08660 [Camelina sativa]
MGTISDSPSLSLSSPSYTPCNSRSSVPTTFSTRIFSDVAGDITVIVDGESFLLHKFPLVARSGKMRKKVRELKDSSSTIELRDFPGGPTTFELAIKFCYGIVFDITAFNVVALRCAAGYLEMTDDYKEENLIFLAENYHDKIFFRSLHESVQVLCSCQTQEMAETFEIPNRCVEAIAMNAYRKQLVSGLSEELKGRDCLELLTEELSALGIDYYSRVVSAMARLGVRSESIVASLVHYAKASVKGIINRNCEEQRKIVEAVVTLLPNEQKGSYSFSIIPLSFLFGMLKVGTIIDIEISCRLELEHRIGHQLETASLDDLLIPSVENDDSLYDVDTVHRILTFFLERIEEEDEECGYDSDSTGQYSSLLKVGRLMDAYLAEIAPDPYLNLHKFTAIIETLPEHARIIDDGIYRAIDMYLKAHPLLTEEESKKLCKFVNCNKLSEEASNHVAQNDRLPVQMVVRVLYSEQMRLKKALSGESEEGSSSWVLSSGVQSRAVSPRDTYASLRRENRDLKLEISRMRVRVSELEKEHNLMKHEMIEKSGNNNGGRTFLTSLSKGIGRIAIFGRENRRMNNRKLRSVSERKPIRRRGS